ncbi:MAG: GTP-binding protein, partial [Candidatus Thiodiazotropha sp. (ex Lucinoma borealis)]|nr:GTP-binding protein [Candidatus Thiodiazotropha sp. (ex Lucinoma borealis)]
MSNYKFIFSGPVGVGKTTAIGAISDVAPVTTDEQASDMTKAQKSGTTVAMDYGMIKLGDRERIHLYGTP